MKKGDGLDDDCDTKKTSPAVLGAFVLSNRRRNTNKFIREKNELSRNNIYYTDTNRLYIEKKYWDVLVKKRLLLEILCQGKNDYRQVVSFTVSHKILFNNR